MTGADDRPAALIGASVVVPEPGPVPPATASLRSLVIAPQWIGDAVMAEPLFARLAARGERLSVAALPWVAPVCRAMAAVHEVIELPFAHGRLDVGARLRLAWTLRGRFDRAYVLPNSLKSALLPWWAGVPERIGYVGENRYVVLNRRWPNPVGRASMVAFYAALAGAQSPGRARPRLQIAPQAIEAAAGSAGVAPGAFFVFAPGAEYGPAKRWPEDRFATLASVLFGRDGAPVLLLGSAGEAALCDRIVAAASPGACRSLAGRTSLAEAMALIAGARGVVSNDSGLMHVAAAFGVPQVAVFGSTSPAHTPPLNDRAKVVWLKEELKLDCAPCFDRSCRFGHTRCLTGVAAEWVDAALRESLGVGAASPSASDPASRADRLVPGESAAPASQRAGRADRLARGEAQAPASRHAGSAAGAGLDTTSGSAAQLAGEDDRPGRRAGG